MQMRVVRIITMRSVKCNSFSTISRASPAARALYGRAGPVLRSSEQRPTIFFGGTMRTRVTALSAVVVTAAGLASSAAVAQTAAAAAPAAEPFTVPRTSWGDPDLQGVWDYRTITPLERRPELGDREFYTDEEIAQLEGRADAPHGPAARPERAGQPRARRVPDGSRPAASTSRAARR